MIPIQINKCNLLLIISLFVIAHSPVFAQTIKEQQLMSALTISLARFTDWPKHSFPDGSSTLKLCVIGGNVVQESFESVDGSLINGKRLLVISTTRLRNIEKCQILYIGELDRRRLRQLLLEMKHRALLTIGNNMEFIQSGGMVALENRNGKIELAININAVKRSGLVISSRILKLARILPRSSD